MTYCKSCLNDSVCLACKNNTYLVNGKCQCLNLPVQTYNITGICLTYPGCVSAANVLNANYCSSCNTSANFKHPSDSNLTCICMSGYNNSDNPLACTPICGDGIINLEACDDNNTANGDGCSNKCIIESNWFCYTSSGTTGPSHCLPISSASISYLYA
jgi:cysteine-rich repeat protein